MSPSPMKTKPTRLNPDWANLPRRKCDNCGKSYKQVRPLRPGLDKYGFCAKECKKQFHKHGAAFIQLRDVCRKEIEKQMRDIEERMREIAREEIADQTLPPDLTHRFKREQMAAQNAQSGKVSRVAPNPHRGS